MSDHFKMTDGAYRIGSNEKGALRNFFLDRIKETGNITKSGKPSKKGVNTKTYIDGLPQYFRNRALEGDLSFDNFGFADKGTKAKEIETRNKNKTYFSEESMKEALATKYKDAEFQQEGSLYEDKGIDMYEEHQDSLDAPKSDLPDDVGSDDLANRKTRANITDEKVDPSVKKTKQAKDKFDQIAKRNKHPWKSFFNPKTDELQVINAEEWKSKGKGKYVDIFKDGITLTPDEVKQWDKATKTGKLGKFPKNKAIYLLKEILNSKSMKFATGASLLGLGALGTGASIADTIQRTDKAKKTGSTLDKIQAGLAGLSTATGATGIGEIVSTPADIANLIIDAARYKPKGPMLGSRSRFKLRDK